MPEKLSEAIVAERTPDASEVIFEPTIGFLDPENSLTRIERAKVVALGDRTAISYPNLAQRVIDERGKTGVARGEVVDKSTQFFLLYALAARSDKEVGHTSIAEQLNAGPTEFGGDSPIVLEGITVLAALRYLAVERHAGFEAFSSRGAIFPEGYWNSGPPGLEGTVVKSEIEAINRDVHAIYKELTISGIEHYETELKRKDGEADWKYRWRLLSYALDEARNVTNGTFLNHLAFHPNSLLAIRETALNLSVSTLPEVRAFADRFRILGAMGAPGLMRYTEPTPYMLGLEEKRTRITQEIQLSVPDNTGNSRDSGLVSLRVTEDAERLFLASFLASQGESGFSEIYHLLTKETDQRIATWASDVISGIGLHDKPPAELDVVHFFMDLEIPVGGILDVLRHRPAQKMIGRFSHKRGFVVPKRMRDAHEGKIYEEAISLNGRLASVITNLGPEYATYAEYGASRANLGRISLDIGGAALWHLLKLRAADTTHPDLSGPMKDVLNMLREAQAPLFRDFTQQG